MELDRKQASSNNLPSCQSQSCWCKRCKRTRKFQELLNHLTLASKATDYEERISATVALICTVNLQFYSY